MFGHQGLTIRDAVVVVVEAAEDRRGHHLAAIWGGPRRSYIHWDRLAQSLVRPALVVIPDVLDYSAAKMVIAQDEQVVQTLAP